MRKPNNNLLLGVRMGELDERRSKKTFHSAVDRHLVSLGVEGVDQLRIRSSEADEEGLVGRCLK